MALKTQPTKWNTYNPQQLNRVEYGNFQGAGIDVFTDPLSQDPTKFLQLLNVLPSTDGGFIRRWGLDVQPGNTFGGLPSGIDFQRIMQYVGKADSGNPVATQDTSYILAVSSTGPVPAYEEEGPTTPATSPTFSGNGAPYGVNSRNWSYWMDGLGQPRKVNYSQGANTPNLSNWGFAKPAETPPSGFHAYPFTAVGGIGSGFTSPTFSGSDGFGTGATFSANLVSGLITLVNVGATGSGYQQNFFLTVTDPSGTLDAECGFTAIVDTVATSGTFGQVVAVVMNAPIILNAWRQYAIAFKNGNTGHTSDFTAFSSRVLPVNPVPATIPIDISPVNAYSKILVSVVLFDTGTLDPQIDTVVIMATSDGGDLEHLYADMEIPLTSFSLVGGYLQYSYFDNLPDTYSELYTGGPTLLTNNLLVDVDVYGNPIGIADNTPPPNNLNKPILHKNRLFATDGRAVYFSKSLSEVTTSTGLITSKWEEAWPGVNELDVAYGNESITGLLSDGDILYIGTTENIYRLLGSSAQDFTIPASVFRGVGVASQDTWTVIYKDNIPAGYIWNTPDNKIMLSDFNTYDEIGKHIYPILQANVLNKISSIQSISYGPYSFAVLAFLTADGSFQFLVADTKNGGWYRWSYTHSSIAPGKILGLLNYTKVSGIETMYVILPDNSGTQFLCKFDPVSGNDGAIGAYGVQNIPWTIQTGWQTLGDDVATKVINEIEPWITDPDTLISVYSARRISDFSSPTLVKTGPYVIGPLGTEKFYLAGSSSRGRYYSFQFGTSATTTQVTSKLISGFSVEFFPTVHM